MDGPGPANCISAPIETPTQPAQVQVQVQVQVEENEPQAETDSNKSHALPEATQAQPDLVSAVVKTSEQDLQAGVTEKVPQTEVGVEVVQAIEEAESPQAGGKTEIPPDAVSETEDDLLLVPFVVSAEYIHGGYGPLSPERNSTSEVYGTVEQDLEPKKVI